MPIITGAVVGVASGASDVHAATTGTLEICKSANNGMAAYSFSFTVVGYASTIPPIQGGRCSASLTVPAGNHLVTEKATSGFAVSLISASPTAALISHDGSRGTATVAGTAGAETVVTYSNKILPSQLKICKQAASDSSQLVGRPFSFTENGGSAFALNAGAFGSPSCSALTTYAAGATVTVAELQPPGSVHVSNIDVTQPPATNVSYSLAGRTASLTLGPGVNVVTYTNQIDVVAQPGFVEICKVALDRFVSGNFSFSVMDAGGVSHGPFSILPGQCSGSIQVTSGPATIGEASRPPYFLGRVRISPADRWISGNLSNGTLAVNIVAGDQSTETLTTFGNLTNLGQVEVCKRLSSDSSDLTGASFTFRYTSTAESAGTVAVTAAPPGQSACTVIPTPHSAGLPLGSSVSITENSRADVRLTGVRVFPKSADAGSTGTTANITVVPGIASATFTNQALGTLQVCKNAADSQTGGKLFTFEVNGRMSVVVSAGQCSMALHVPVGTATILEESSANFHQVSVTATGPTLDDRLLSGPNPANVTVLFGGVGNETLATFTNATNIGVFQICKTTTTSAPGSGNALGGETFSFDWSYSVDGTLYSGTTALTLPAGASGGVNVCSSLIGAPTGANAAGIPVVQSNGSSVTVNVVEALFPGVHVLSIKYFGNGRLTAKNLMTQTAALTLGQGVNSITYDNEPNPP